MHINGPRKKPARAASREVGATAYELPSTQGVRVEFETADGARLWVTMTRDESARLRTLMVRAEQSEVSDVQPFEADGQGFVDFYADGQEAPCEHFEFKLETEEHGDFHLRCDGDLHDGFCSVDEVAKAFPRVAPTLVDWKAGRLYDFDLVLRAARDAFEGGEPCTQSE